MYDCMPKAMSAEIKDINFFELWKQTNALGNAAHECLNPGFVDEGNGAAQCVTGISQP